MIQVDRVVTISLAENQSRRETTQSELNKLQLKTDFFLAARDKGHEERGCFNSHLTVCREALYSGCQSVLILEDDVKILSFSKAQIKRINYFITHHAKEFDVLYLGLIIGKMWFCWQRSIVRAKGSGAHAYILSRRGMEKLFAYEYAGVPFDKVLKHDFKCYSVYPIIADQFPETTIASDISPSRNSMELKDEAFWRDNYRKQKSLPWLNLHKTIFEK